MGTNIRTRLSGSNSDGSDPSLSERDVESALGRLAAYDVRPDDRRRPPSTTPALRRRAGLWKR
jgi:hypothetical protein